MAIIEVTELAEDRTLTVYSTWAREATRTFRVKSTTKDIGPSWALFAAGIPAPQDAYETDDEIDLGLVVDRVVCRHDPAEMFTFRVTVTYTSYKGADPTYTTAGLGGGGGGGGGGPPGGGAPPNDNPLDEPPRAIWGQVHDTVVREREYVPDLIIPAELDVLEGDPIRNTALTPFQPRPVADESRQTLTYIRNQLTFDQHDARTWFDSVNRTPFLSYSAEEVKCDWIVGESQFRNGLSFWTVTHQFSIRKGTWVLSLLDQGPNVLEDTPNGRKRVRYKKEGFPDVTLLDGNGRPLSENGTPVFLPFRIYPRKNFDELNIVLPP